MSQGLLFCFLTSVAMTAVAISLSYIARKRLVVVAVMTVASIVIAGSLWVFWTDFSRITQTPQLMELSLVLLSAGIISTCIALVGQKAMRSGHHGIIWIISQSAILLSFLFGIIGMGEPATFRKIAGMLVVMVSFILIGLNKSSGKTAVSGSSHLSWKMWAFINFFLVGLFQILSALPSYWPDWADPAR
ncbi:hypothetical protein KAH55_10085, partial [bacterium]|nr:hypothetical protein [bacterium]